MMVKKLLLASLLASSLSACVPVLVAGGVAVGAWIGSDPRKSETQADDFQMGTRVLNKVYDTYKSAAHVNVNVFNGCMLLTGEVPDETVHAAVLQIARSEKGLKQLHDELVIAPPSGTGDRANDTQLSARVKAAVLGQAGDASSIHISIITERKVVYLMGSTTPEIADRAAKAAANVSGVVQVVKLMQYTDAAR
ncbi:Osmotically-inducible protein OsmY, contains BON domain [Andreprevotia lacus DSM 23236]|jgi:osmotically-inducible protein OsmY|uniref:Osmotically-inducible protein OsmY, contains BON domain n=1 Tax=Andreprevotia lacus DSM 23236 TaxID=1121001 RepID=A0A1W1WXR6_9NEIS|nr:BON domain-containing protein [Andreprevotia lacus]SMC16397.1 Osmotically-inducible protein OsmY, contains BON domain [Andreprevotia lacus DSM 23236]